MSDLEGIFKELLGDHELDPIVAGATPILAPRLSALCARGREAFPRLLMTDEVFVRHLARCLVTGADAPVPLEQLAVEDLYLACACTERVAGAVEAFEARCVGPIRSVIATFTRIASELEDIEQLVRMTVLVGSPTAPPKIGTYLGCGPLGRWASVVAQRIALSILRTEGPSAGARDLTNLSDALDWRDPGVALMKERYKGEFQQALEDAISKLAKRSRLLLRLNLVDGVSTVGLARMFGVTQPTASRWLAHAREEIADEMGRLLAERLSLPASEIESLAGLVVSQLDMSLSMLLATAA